MRGLEHENFAVERCCGIGARSKDVPGPRGRATRGHRSHDMPAPRESEMRKLEFDPAKTDEKPGVIQNDVVSSKRTARPGKVQEPPPSTRIARPASRRSG